MKVRYICKYCGKVNSIDSAWKWFWTPHFGAKKYLKCKHHTCSFNDKHFMKRLDGRRWIDWPTEKDYGKNSD